VSYFSSKLSGDVGDVAEGEEGISTDPASEGDSTSTDKAGRRDRRRSVASWDRDE
jgi:hypothetical protein